MKVFIIGTGNVATTLGKAFTGAGHSITGIFGRTEKNVRSLAKKLHCKSYTDPAAIPLNADVYLIAIKDDALESVVTKLPELKGVVAHTAGATPMKILGRFRYHGVFYPVETITKTFRVSLKQVPICIEGFDETSFKKLMQLARSVSEETYSLDSDQRAVLHLAAVYTNNFTNALLGIAGDLLENENLPLNLLKPLALTTVKNAFSHGAIESQTGPAKRNDTRTLQKHLELLSLNEEYSRIYRLLSRHIRNVHKKK
jgi:predicted short-subunit dehydrogenase-like oxidoreductase (DUF2520 family)